MLNLNDLYLFVQVVDRRGFAPAARALNMPKSTLSKRVAELEKRLEVRLIHRTSRRFVVTEVGEDFYRHAAAMLIEAEAAEQVVQGRLAEPSGMVRLTASVPTAQLRLADSLPALAQAYPKVRLELHASDRFVDIVQEGFDIAVRDHLGPLPDSELVQRRIATEPSVLVAAPRYLDQRGTPDRPEALDSHDGLLTAPSATIWTLRHAATAPVEVRPAPRYIADESMALLEAATAGLGIVPLPRLLCRSRLESGALVQVLPEWTAGEITTTLLLPHRRGQLPAVRAVVEFLLAALAEERVRG